MSLPAGLVAQLRRWVAGVLDLTERGEAEALLAASAGRERAAQAEAEAAHRARHEFVSHLSHELRAPLNAQLLWLRLLRSGTLDAATSQRALETIEENLRCQNRLIDDLVDAQRDKRDPGEAADSLLSRARDGGSGTPSGRAAGAGPTGE